MDGRGSAIARPEWITGSAFRVRRNADGRTKKALDVDKLAEISARNFNKYGDNLGPTVDWLRSQGKSWDDIIESAGRIGGKDLGF